MKKVIAFIVVLLAMINLSACQPEIKEGDVIVNNPAPTEPRPSGVNVFLKTSIAAGEWGMIEIYRIINDEEYAVQLPEDGSTILNQACYSYELVPGDYHLSINGLNYNADADFTVESGEMTDLEVSLTEWEIPTFWIYTNTASPSGMVVPGVNQEIFRFNIAHNWDTPLTPNDLGFYIALGGTAQVDNCQVQVMTQTGYQTIGGPVGGSCNDLGCWFSYDASYDIGLGKLDTDWPIYPNSPNTYSLRCDISGSPGDVMEASLNAFGADTGGIEYMVGSWAYGNMLAF